MASSGKRKTTMAKLARERRLHERRMDKQAKKDARKQAAMHPRDDELTGEVGESAESDVGQEDLEPVAQQLPEA